MAALREWASGYGRLAAETVGREAELDRLAGEYGHGQDRDPEAFGNWVVRHSAAFSLKLAELGLSVPAGLDDEIAGINRLLVADTHRVFSPGDICPDNNLLTPDGLRMLDFEGGVKWSVSFRTLPTTGSGGRVCTRRWPSGQSACRRSCWAG